MTAKRDILMESFDRLLSHFGPRHWWPGETPFEVMVGAILTQNTNWKNVEQAIANLKREGLFDRSGPKKMIALHPARLAMLIRPAGYFRVKAARLRHFLKFFIEHYDGDVAQMREQPMHTMREELLSVKGIGPETADSILLYALEKPSFVVDAYTRRILSRHALCAEDESYDDLQAIFMDRLQLDAKLYNEYHALIVQTGKEFCRTTPRCEECPLNGWNGKP